MRTIYRRPLPRDAASVEECRRMCIEDVDCAARYAARVHRVSMRVPRCEIDNSWAFGLYERLFAPVLTRMQTVINPTLALPTGDVET